MLDRIGASSNLSNYEIGKNEYDPGVSFKAPTKMSPALAATQVLNHEGEHYAHEQADAAKENKDVLLNKIQVFTDVCTECGKTYVSGGLTTTVTRKKAENLDSLKKFFEETVGKYKPKQVDIKA